MVPVLPVEAAKTRDSRAGHRSNVFLMAALTGSMGSGAVRVRNLSASGALLEGAVLPNQGENALLRRGGLSVAGEIAWSRGSQCGMRFDSRVSVEDWVRRAGPEAQQNIDAAIAEFRGGRNVPAARLSPISKPERRPGSSGAAAEILKACERIAALPCMTGELADELLKIEALARTLGADG